MSASSINKQYFQVFSKSARSYDRRNAFLKKDRTALLFGEFPSEPHLVRHFGRRHTELSTTQTTLQTAASEKSIVGTSVFKAQSREDYYKAMGRQRPGPGVGHYKSNYKCVERRTSVVDFTQRPQTRATVREVPPEIALRLVDKPASKLKLPIHFDKQLGRPAYEGELNENRFTPFNDKPSISTGVRRVSTPHLGKTRGHALEFKESLNAQIYDPQMTSVQPSPSKGVLPFSKGVARKSLKLEHWNDLNYDPVCYKLTEKTSPSFSIHPTSSSDSKLPSHMTVSLT